MVVHYRCYQVRPAAQHHTGWEVCRLDPARRDGEPARAVVIGAGYATQAAARVAAQEVADADGPLGWVLAAPGVPGAC